MNRTLKRPMFRIGGSAGTGITSGLDQPRKQYNTGSNPYAMGSFQSTGLPGFLTSFGLNLLSTPPSGNIFQTAALAAQDPFRRLQADQAAAARQQDIANRSGLASQQLNLGQFQTGLGQTAGGITGTNISRLGSLGALNQAQAQAQLDAQRAAARQATFLPQEQLDRYAAQVTGIMVGYPGQRQTTNIPNPTPLQTALGVGTTLAGIYGGLKNPTTTDFGGFFKKS